MPVLNSQTVGNSYPTGATGAILQDVWNSRGGWFSISGAGAFVQLQYGSLGEPWWTDEILLGAGAFVVLPSNCIGVRFRNSVANAIATVTAQLAQGKEPPLAISSYGQTNVVSVASLNFQHNDLAVATEPTLDFEDTAGPANLVWTLADDAANTRLKLGVTWASPTVFPNDVGGGSASTVPGAATGFLLQAQGDLVFSRAAASPVIGVAQASSADTQYRWQVDTNGKLQWGSGGVPDTTLARGGAGQLQLGTVGQSGTLAVVTGAAGTAAVESSVTSDAQFRYVQTGDGTLKWGPGNAAQDTTLLRNGAGVLQLGTASQSGTLFVVPGSTGTAALEVALGADTQFRYIVAGDGSTSWGPGNTAQDTTLARVTNAGSQAQLVVGNKLLQAARALVTGSVPLAFTPDLNLGLVQVVDVTGGGAGTLTINNPVHPPSSTQGCLLVIGIANNGGGVITIAWGGGYSAGNTLALPANLANGKYTAVTFVWDGGGWRIVSVG